MDNLLPLALPDGAPGDVPGIGALIAKWTFVAAWSAYGGEMASTVCAEVRDCSTYMPRAMSIVAGICVATFVFVPLALLGIAGSEGLREDPLTAFVPAARIVFGPAAETAIGLTLVAVLVLGAQAFIYGSSRTVYQLALDGHLPRAFATVNRRGVPVGSLMDTVVIGVMLLVFGTRVVDVVARPTSATSSSSSSCRWPTSCCAGTPRDRTRPGGCRARSSRWRWRWSPSTP